MKVRSKAPRTGGKKAVSQMRGPGMNKGLKKPRHAKFYKGEPEKSGDSGGKSSTKSGNSGSYLGDSMLHNSGKSGSSGGPGKQLFSKIFRSAP